MDKKEGDDKGPESKIETHPSNKEESHVVDIQKTEVVKLDGENEDEVGVVCEMVATEREGEPSQVGEDGESSQADGSSQYSATGPHLMSSSSYITTSSEAATTTTSTNTAHLYPVNSEGQTIRIQLSNFSTIHMRAFHMTWVAFFICFLGWFSLSPMLYSVMLDIGLTKDQVTFSNQAVLAVTILMRICMGVVCDQVGPRKAYAVLMFVGSLPLIFVSLAESFVSFTICRTLIGILGASFVITEYHTQVMFAPNVVGLASATVAGWGNLGGGVTNAAMPYLVSKMGFLVSDTGKDTQHKNWRLAIVIPGIMLIIMSFLYYKGTKDTPYGNRNELPAEPSRERGEESWWLADWLRDVPAVFTDYRVTLLTLAYAACFGVELVFLTQGSLYFMEQYEMSDISAGHIVLLYSCLNLFCRPLGGWVSDKAGIHKNLHWRVYWLAFTLLLEAGALFLFAVSQNMIVLIVVTFLAGLMTMLAEGATYAVVPFINQQSLGLVSGIVAAGGNIGGVLLLSLFRHGINWDDSFLYLGVVVLAISLVVPFLRFPESKLQQFALNESIYRNVHT